MDQLSFSFLPSRRHHCLHASRDELKTRSSRMYFFFVHLRIKNFLSFRPFLIQLPFLFKTSWFFAIHSVVVFAFFYKKKGKDKLNKLLIRVWCLKKFTSQLDEIRIGLRKQKYIQSKWDILVILKISSSRSLSSFYDSHTNFHIPDEMKWE